SACSWMTLRWPTHARAASGAITTTSKQRTTLKRTGETSSGPWVFEVDEVLLAHLLSLLVPFRRLGQSILLCPGLGGVCAQRRALVLRCLLLEEGGVLLQQRLR